MADTKPLLSCPRLPELSVYTSLFPSLLAKSPSGLNLYHLVLSCLKMKSPSVKVVTIARWAPTTQRTTDHGVLRWHGFVGMLMPGGRCGGGEECLSSKISFTCTWILAILAMAVIDRTPKENIIPN